MSHMAYLLCVTLGNSYTHARDSVGKVWLLLSVDNLFLILSSFCVKFLDRLYHDPPHALCLCTYYYYRALPTLIGFGNYQPPLTPKLPPLKPIHQY